MQIFVVGCKGAPVLRRLIDNLVFERDRDRVLVTLRRRDN